MKNKTFMILLLILNSIAAIIFCISFYNTAIFVDEKNLSPSDIVGGTINAKLEWLALICLGISILLLLYVIVKDNKNKRSFS